VPAYSSAQIKAVYDFNDKNSLTVNAYGNLDNVKFNNDTEENIQDNETILDNDQKGYVNTFELKSLLTKKSFALFNLGRTYNTFKYLGRDSLFNDVFRKMIGLRILNRVNDFSHDISFGERYMQRLLDQPMTLGKDQQEQIETYFEEVARVRRFVRNAETDNLGTLDDARAELDKRRKTNTTN